MKAISLLAAAGLASLTPLAVCAAGPDAYNVVWDSPSANHHGSMPLGNGDIALNAWMTPDGDLHFYISKTDAWDDNARLLKVGKVRIHFEPNPVATAKAYRQELKLNEGCMEIRLGADPSTPGAPPVVTIRLWVDANHPVVHVTAESATPLEATACVEIWRTNQQELAEVQCSDVMNHPGRPQSKHAATLLEPDRVLTGQRDRIGWFHHNIKSVGPQLLTEVQGLTGFQQPDPLLHRTFGAVVTAPRGERLDDLRLRSPRGTSHRFSVFVLTRHPATPEGWLAEMDDTIGKIEAQDFAGGRAAHERWWSEFWNRSWIRASASANAKAPVESIVPPNQHAVRIGMDQGGGNRFAGDMGRVSLFGKPLTEAEIVAQARSGVSAERRQLIEVPADLRRSPEPPLRPLFTGLDLKPQVVSNSGAWDFGPGFTIEAWVKPETLGGGARFVDKITPGGSDGFLLDTHPGNSLRFICGQRILSLPKALPAGHWTHVAAVADAAAGGCRLYVNGRLAATDAGASRAR